MEYFLQYPLLLIWPEQYDVILKFSKGELLADIKEPESYLKVCIRVLVT
jgi:hypothetical protein